LANDEESSTIGKSNQMAQKKIKKIQVDEFPNTAFFIEKIKGMHIYENLN